MCMHATKKKIMTLKENKRGYMRGFGEKKGIWGIMQLYYNYIRFNGCMIHMRHWVCPSTTKKSKSK